MKKRKKRRSRSLYIRTLCEKKRKRNKIQVKSSWMWKKKNTEEKNLQNLFEKTAHRTFHLVDFVLFRFSFLVKWKFRGDYYDFSHKYTHTHKSHSLYSNSNTRNVHRCFWFSTSELKKLNIYLYIKLSIVSIYLSDFVVARYIVCGVNVNFFF